MLTRSGLTRLSDVSVGDLIWTREGWSQVANKWSAGVKKVYRYRTTAGIFEGTEDHKVMCGGFKVPVKCAHSIDILRGKYIEKVNIDSQAVMDGLLIGDGTVKNSSIALCLGMKDNDILKSEVSNLIRNPTGDQYSWYVRSTLKLEDLPRTYDRKVPDKYKYSSREQTVSFLRGLYSANGSICARRVTLKAASRQIIDDVQLMLNAIGIRSYYTTNKESTIKHANGTYTSKQSYDLNITTDADRFVRTIGFIQQYKMDKINNLLDNQNNSKEAKSTYEIIETEYIGEEEVFDITVDNDLHTFWNGGCDVSNCGEIGLQHRELCDVAETAPTRCYGEDGKFSVQVWLQACEYCTFYCNTVQLLPTHQASTNKVMAKNRRIGVSLIDFIGWKNEVGMNKIIKYLRQGYKRVRKVARWSSDEAGVPEPIRVTCVKPGGTVPKMAGRRSGIGYSNFRYMIRRIEVKQYSPLYFVLENAGIPHEPKQHGTSAEIFEIPIDTGPGKTAEQASIWEQANNLVLVQREWADNAVSNTLMFRPRWILRRRINNLDVIESYAETARDIWGLDKLESFEDKHWKIECNEDTTGRVIEILEYQYNPNHEEDDVEAVLSSIAPSTKSVSALPHSAKGVYKQMPEEGITETEYRERSSVIKKIDWSSFIGSEGEDEKYCQGETCIVLPE